MSTFEKRIFGDEEFDITLHPADSAGDPEKLDGMVTYVSSDESVLTVTPSTDTLSAVASGTGVAGTAVITISGDANLGAPVDLLEDTINVTVDPPEATTLGTEVGTTRKKSTP